MMSRVLLAIFLLSADWTTGALPTLLTVQQVASNPEVERCCCCERGKCACGCQRSPDTQERPPLRTLVCVCARETALPVSWPQLDSARFVMFVGMPAQDPAMAPDVATVLHYFHGVHDPPAQWLVPTFVLLI